MSNEPYAPPEANLVSATVVNVPEEITKKIKGAWIAGIISVSITVIFTLIAMSGTELLGLNAYAFVDAALMAIFTYGIYKNSRVCAVLMLALFLANKVIMWIDNGVQANIVMALVFLWFYSRGVIGTFQYHNFIRKQV